MKPSTLEIECPKTPKKSIFVTKEDPSYLTPQKLKISNTTSTETCPESFTSNDDDNECYFHFNGDYSPSLSRSSIHSSNSCESSEIGEFISRWAKTIQTSSDSRAESILSDFTAKTQSPSSSFVWNKNSPNRQQFVMEIDSEMLRNIKRNSQNLTKESISPSKSKYRSKLGIVLFFIISILLIFGMIVVSYHGTESIENEDGLHRHFSSLDKGMEAGIMKGDSNSSNVDNRKAHNSKADIRNRTVSN